MKNNKGYSLVELLLAIAVFSILMVAIITMMRTSLASYTDGLFEAELQQEAQIVANQVSDVLIDATQIVSKSSATDPTVAKTYKFKRDEATEFTISYSGVGANGVGTLSYGETGHASQTISDSVCGFVISGIDVPPTLTPAEIAAGKTIDYSKFNYDNAVSVEVDFKPEGNRKTSFNVSREVFFRNNIETSQMFDVESGSSTEESSSDNKDDIILDVDRYDVINLTEEYGFTEILDATIDHPEYDTYKSWYDVQKPVSGATFHDSGSCLYVKCNSILNGQLDNEISADVDHTILFCKYTTSDGTEGVKKIKLNTKPVDIINETEVDGNKQKMIVGYYSTEYERPEQGYQTYLPVQGINIHKARKEVSIKYDMIFNLNGASYSRTGCDLENNDNAAIGSGGEQINLGGAGIVEMKLKSDPCSHGIMVTTGGQRPSLSGTNNTITFKISINGSSPIEKEYKFLQAGQNL